MNMERLGPHPVAEQWRRHLLWLGPLLGGAVTLAMLAAGWAGSAALAGGLTLVCALWWIVEPIPIPATALIPLGLFPLLNIIDGGQVAAAFGSPLILLMLGGFMLSKAMEQTGTHRRIALGMVRLFGGGSARRLVFGFMAASALLSMWISNTATALMLLPVALAVLDQAPDKRLAAPLLLGVAYAASIGGIGTPIGTPPNVILMTIYADATGNAITFGQWMAWALPLVVVFVPVVGWWLTRGLVSAEPLRVPAMGRWRPAEVRVLAVFALTALAWITLDAPFGGWKAWLAVPAANYAAVALTAVLLLFLLPDGEGGRLLNWEHAVRVPWDVLILFAGGIAIAKAFASTGISAAIGEQLAGLGTLPLWLLVGLICLLVTFLTEVTSNTATTTLLMPVFAATGLALGVDPLLLMVPAAMSASCAFMLPVATPPNAVMFGSGQFPLLRMAREGLALNLLGAGLITVLVTWWVA